MKLSRLIIWGFVIGCFVLGLGLQAQNKNVAITDDQNYNPNPSAMLDVYSTNKGILIPRVNSTSNVSNPTNGLLVYQTSDNTFYYYDGSIWKKIGGGGGGTLQAAYDFGGAGAGRLITVSNAGVPVEIKYQGSGAGIGLKVTNSTDGVCISTENTNVNSNYSTIQSVTRSNKNTTTTTLGAVVGYTEGNAHGLAGQASQSSKADAAILGSHLNMAPPQGEGYAGVMGTGFIGVFGNTDVQGSAGIMGQGNTTQGYGLQGSGATGVYGIGNNSGISGDGGAQGVLGTGYGSFGVVGQTTQDGQTVDPDGLGIYSQNNIVAAGDIYAGFDLQAGGYLASVLGKEFRIDHPFDPENKYLKHFSIESNEILNVYRGNVTLNANGEATITLPNYFSEINDKFSYNLTAVGDAAPNLHVKTKVNGNTFSVAGGKAGMEVSWTLYCERNDKVYRENPEYRNVEVMKPNKFRGKYLRPELFGQPKEKGIYWVDNSNIKINPKQIIRKSDDKKILLPVISR